MIYYCILYNNDNNIMLKKNSRAPNTNNKIKYKYNTIQ